MKYDLTVARLLNIVCPLPNSYLFKNLEDPLSFIKSCWRNWSGLL